MNTTISFSSDMPADENIQELVEMWAAVCAGIGERWEKPYQLRLEMDDTLNRRRVLRNLGLKVTHRKGRLFATGLDYKPAFMREDES